MYYLWRTAERSPHRTRLSMFERSRTHSLYINVCEFEDVSFVTCIFHTKYRLFLYFQEEYISQYKISSWSCWGRSRWGRRWRAGLLSAESTSSLVLQPAAHSGPDLTHCCDWWPQDHLPQLKLPVINRPTFISYTKCTEHKLLMQINPNCFGTILTYKDAPVQYLYLKGKMLIEKY